MAPSTLSVLQTLSKARLLELARSFAVAVPLSATKDAQAEALASAGSIRFGELLLALGRDELKLACRTHGLDDAGRARPALAARLLEAHGEVDSVSSRPLFMGAAMPEMPRTKATSCAFGIVNGSSKRSPRRPSRATARG